jgi:DNA-binding transcriptional ArsR family regulator
MATGEAVGALRALAHETRLEVFRLLVRSGPAGMPAGAIAEALGVPAPTLSFHLKELRQAGLVEGERRGRSHVYRPDYGAMDDLVSYLTENCCEGVPGAVDDPTRGPALKRRNR